MRTRIPAISIALLVALTTASPARAEPPVDLMLGNGTLIRGVIVERAPYRHVVVVDQDGVLRRFVWSELSLPTADELVADDERDRRAKAFAARSPPFAPDQVYVWLRVQPREVRRRGGTRWVRDDASLYALGAERPLCALPCEAMLDPKLRYQIRGDMSPSAPFQAPPGRATYAMVASSTPTHVIGTVMMLAGGLVSATALAMMATDRGHVSIEAIGLVAGLITLGGGGVWLMQQPSDVRMY